uniref:Solute carrier family 6 (neurotransmitter transporter, betaine/GABA), member 12 n=1 Tax=Mus musculus TaxID=10090 RepID=E9Q5U8_MOUSE
MDRKVAVHEDGYPVVSWVPEEGEMMDQKGKDQELSSSPTSSSSSAVASQCSSWRWHWASIAARGV